MSDYQEIKESYDQQQAQRKNSTTVYLTYEQRLKLKLLTQKTGVPGAHIIRKALDDHFAKYQDVFDAAKK